MPRVQAGTGNIIVVDTEGNLHNSMYDIEYLQSEIDDLKAEIKMLKEHLNLTKSEKSNSTNSLHVAQNKPNPFSESTDILFNIPPYIEKATLHVYNLQGEQIMEQNLEQRGEGSKTLNASGLKPGIYLYTIIADGISVGIKQMTITG